MNIHWRKCAREVYLERGGSCGCDLDDRLQVGRKVQASIVTMKPAMVLLFGFGLVFLAGCAAFETTPKDVAQKLTHPLDGHLYVPDLVDKPPQLVAY